MSYSKTTFEEWHPVDLHVLFDVIATVGAKFHEKPPVTSIPLSASIPTHQQTCMAGALCAQREICGLGIAPSNRLELCDQNSEPNRARWHPS